jgi:hypothetical protein
MNKMLMLCRSHQGDGAGAGYPKRGRRARRWSYKRRRDIYHRYVLSLIHAVNYADDSEVTPLREMKVARLAHGLHRVLFRQVPQLP